MKNYAFDNMATDIADNWAGPLHSHLHEPELARYIRRVLDEYAMCDGAEGPPNLKSVIAAAEWFNRVNCHSELSINSLAKIVLTLAAGEMVEAKRPTPLESLIAKLDPAVVARYGLVFEPRAIRYEPISLIAAADEAETAMLTDPNAEPVFAHGGAYATIRTAKAVTVRDVATGSTRPAISHLTDPAAMRARLMASAKVYTWRAKTSKRQFPNGTVEAVEAGEWVQGRVPDDLVKNILARKGGAAPPLVGLLPTPTVCPDGRAIEQPGYDEATGLYATFGTGEFAALKNYAIPDLPPDIDLDLHAVHVAQRERDMRRAQADAAESRAWLESEWLGEFDFREKVDAAAAVAAVVTGLVRPTCELAPGFLFSSPMQSTGKTTLMQAIGSAVEGAAPALNDWPVGEEEMGKLIFSALRAGRSILAFDNLPAGAVARSQNIARLLSAETIEARVLGVSEMGTAPTSALVMLTGNNVTLEGDMVTRIAEVYLDAQTERPEDRVFQRDILRWTVEHRATIVEKALTIVRAYLAAGAPPVAGVVATTRFHTWDKMVRRAIIWAGGADIAAKFVAASQADPVAAQLRDMLGAWATALGHQPLTSGELAAKLRANDFAEDGGAFREALLSLVGQRQTHVMLDARLLGIRLKQFLNRPAGGLRLVSEWDPRRKVHTWAVERLAA